MEPLTAKFAEKLSSIGVKNSYGTPLEVDGATIVPVALISFGFGGGEANETDPEHLGDPGSGGGGGGGMSIPVGAYVTCNGTTRFQPNTVALLAASIPLVCATGFALTRIIKALKN